MCGIVGAISKRSVTEILLNGLNRLEYRGYDSAGVAILSEEKPSTLQRLRRLGKVSELRKSLEETPLAGTLGIAHTRWATHGKPNQGNAHPHCSTDKDIAVVHNGIIENHVPLREKLVALGYQFDSETDSEIIAHLIHHYAKTSEHFLDAIHRTTQDLKGAFALGIVSSREPHTLYAVRHGSPLVIGIGTNEHFIASDPLALSSVAEHFIYLEEGDSAAISVDEFQLYDLTHKPVERTIHHTKISDDVASKGQYEHFMLKEIFEQPQAILDTLGSHCVGSRVPLEAFGHRAKDILPKIKRVQIVACGTSYHAGLVARHWFEGLAGIPCQVDVASEYRYRDNVVEPDALFVALSQSGETADTLAALRQAKEIGFSATLSICNMAESSLVRESDLAFLTRAGTEIGVAATKTFTAQLTALLLLTLALNKHEEKQITSETLDQLPGWIQQTLELDQTIQTLSKSFSDKRDALFLGRGAQYPIALEGALKLKEISYMHAEAYPAGELKHGPLALVDEQMPVIVVAPKDKLVEKLESNLQEVQARGGQLTVFLDETLDWKAQDNVEFVKLPSVPEVLAPIVYTIPLQLLSYHVAVLKGTDVDQPRNLAKSVTVE